MKAEVVSAPSPTSLELLIQKQISRTELQVRDIKFSTVICWSLLGTRVMYSAMILFEEVKKDD